MSSGLEIEISKLLHASFNGGTGEPIGAMELARMWSLEMQWFSPEVAYTLVERLHVSGWLVGEESGLFPCASSFNHPPELGWRPFLSRVGEIPIPPASSTETSVEPPVPPIPISTDNRPDKEEGTTGKLASMVAKMSGLEKREVIRRAQRKRRALGPVSLEVAMLLLAREQNLEMDDLAELT
jgi:hypothetical protein